MLRRARAFRSLGDHDGSRTPGPSSSQAAWALAGMLTDPLAGYQRLTARYGDVVRVPYAPGRCFYLLGRPEHAEHVLAAGQDNYVKAFTYRPLRILVGNGLLTSEGEAWRQHRRLIQPTFSRREVIGFGPHMTAVARRLADHWDVLPDGAIIDAVAEMRALALEIIGLTLFGTDLTGEVARLRKALGAGQQIAVLTALLPLGWGPRCTRTVKMAARWAGSMDGAVSSIVAARRTVASGSNGAQPADLLDVLLQARNGQGMPLTDSEIKDEVATFLLAGHETSANTIAWSLALLSAYPAARKRLEEELDAALGGRDPDVADVPGLPWTRAVVSEALRLFPPAWTIERDAIADDVVAGVPIPARSLVVISPYLVHRHPDFWPEPAGFDPQRFLPGGHGDPAVRHRYAFIPFGGGRRGCLGASFAELETVLALATIVRRYRLELAIQGMPHPVAKVTLGPGRSLPMRLCHRS